MAEATLLQKLFVTACAITRSTDLAARWTGAAPFLPALFVLRYANMGGLDQTEFAEQIRAARSFRDDRWCGYWNAIADAHARRATDLLRSLADIDPGTESTDVPDLADVGAATAAEDLDRLTACARPRCGVVRRPRTATGHRARLPRSSTSTHPPVIGRESRWH